MPRRLSSKPLGGSIAEFLLVSQLFEKLTVCRGKKAEREAHSNDS